MKSTKNKPVSVYNKSKKSSSATNIIVGKDLIDVFSSATYLNPLAIYREYIQNAVDSIDNAVSTETLQNRLNGKIELNIDRAAREVTICDNGIGIEKDLFFNRLTSFGNSIKRATNARGFRGIGRLAGLGYCQELIFRTKSSNSNSISELSWDCVKLKQLLSDNKYNGQLNELVNDVTKIREIDGLDSPTNFFEVRIVRPRRIGRDILLNQGTIKNYLSQVAPVPFSQDFKFKSEIESLFHKNKLDLPEYNIFVNAEQVFRPHTNSISYSLVNCGPIEKIDQIKICSRDGSNKSSSTFAAIGWIAHHEYQGAIPKAFGIRGLRARIGNMQIGDDNLFSNLFDEERFNSWSIGEIHIIDRSVIPNARRDGFEISSQYNDLESHMILACNNISKKCRIKSQIRNKIKKVESECKSMNELIEILKNNVLTSNYQIELVCNIRNKIDELKNEVTASSFSDKETSSIKSLIMKLSNKVKKVETNKKSCFNNLSDEKEKTVRELIDVVYANSQNNRSALNIIEGIMEKLNSE